LGSKHERRINVLTNYIIYAYGFYLLASIVLTIWVARTLHRNGRVFLLDAFGGNAALADSVNHLLVVGFYLINIGYVALMLKESRAPENLRETIEFLSTKMGLVLLILGGMHFFNLYVFSRLRRRGLAGHDDWAGGGRIAAPPRPVRPPPLPPVLL
jgi:hypothetical protein